MHRHTHPFPLVSNVTDRRAKMSKRLSHLFFSCSDLERTERFYCGKLGFRKVEEDVLVKEGRLVLSATATATATGSGVCARLVFRQGEEGSSYEHSRDDAYWKIGLTMTDVGLGSSFLQRLFKTPYFSFVLRYQL